MQKTGTQFWLWCLLLIFFTSCKKEDNVGQINSQASFKGLVVPSYFPPTHYQFTNNPITENGFELGRKLFYDKKLSKTNSVSCGSCHAQVHGFADHGTPYSFGIYGRMGKRNSPALFNLAWTPSFMWDGGINHIEVMPLAPLTDTLEMGETMQNIVTKLQSDVEYGVLFEKAFGAGEITDQKLFRALAQFMSMIVSSDSKYDRVQRAETTFSSLEQTGYGIFQQKCNSCHTEPLFTNFSYKNNGIDSTFTDLGRMRITQQPEDLGKFKVPSLRNLNFTYPYMHDGRYFTLDRVLDHYSNVVTASPNIDAELENGMSLTPDEKIALKAFLNTLNDYTYIGDHKFAEP